MLDDCTAYDAALKSARDHFARRIENLSPTRDFLLRYNGYGVGMTEPVEGWIRRAGERCLLIGYDDLGQYLVSHAKSESGHHRMMLADLEKMGGEKALASPPWPASVNLYRNLHEHCIVSCPWAQIAIEYEIEKISVDHGHRLKGLSTFVDEHIDLDQAHTDANRRHLALFLGQYPHHTTSLIMAGITALHAYGDFIEECAG